jgi:hypothetical protein
MPKRQGGNGMENEKRTPLPGAQHSAPWEPWIPAMGMPLLDEEYRLWLEQRVFDEEETE